MRILLLSDNFPPETNAPANRALEHGRAWAAAGHEVTVLTGAPNFPQGKVHAGYRNRWYDVSEVEGIRVVRVKTYIAANAGFLRRTLDYLSYMVSAFVAGLFQPKPDVVVGTSPQFFAAVGAWLLATVRRVPFVMEVRDLWPESIVAVGALKPGFVVRRLEGLELRLYRRARRIVVVTESFRADLVRRGVARGKIEVVFNGVDPARFRPGPRDEGLAAELGVADRFVVGYLGTTGMAHALDNVLDAAEATRGDARLVWLIVGAGAGFTSLDAARIDRGLENVVLRPPVPRADMPRLWRTLDVALLHLKDVPTFAGVLPSKLFEALACGRPVLIAAPEGEASALVRRHRVGVAVPPEDPVALAEAAQSLSRDPAGCQVLSAAARETAPRFGRPQQAARMLAVLERAQRPIGTTRPDGR